MEPIGTRPGSTAARGRNHGRDAGGPAAPVTRGDGTLHGEQRGRAHQAASALVRVEIEQALGPGIEFEPGDAGLIGRRLRPGAAWLGFDRAALVDSDDGHGRRLPVVVGLPASTFVGARLDVELIGGWSTPAGPVLVGQLPGGATPLPALAGIVAGIGDDSDWLDRAAAEHEARRARQRDRERRSHARIHGGRAWQPSGALPPEHARFVTPHSLAEYRLSRLPPRYLRGLEGLLDDDERVLYWVERPMRSGAGPLGLLRGRIDRRAALLALTDRQLLWIVDHAQPDRYLSDWGVDIELVPVERVIGVRCTEREATAELTVATSAGSRTFRLPAEHGREVQVMGDLLARFAPAGDGSAPRRRYPLETIEFDPEPAIRFSQEPDARRLLAVAQRAGPLLAFLYSPSRPGQRHPAAFGLTRDAVALADQAGERRIALTDVRTVELTLSPLTGRLSFGPRLAIGYPAPLASYAAAFARLTRRAVANVP